jgi:hypothetical protein
MADIVHAQRHGQRPHMPLPYAHAEMSALWPPAKQAADRRPEIDIASDGDEVPDRHDSSCQGA